MLRPQSATQNLVRREVRALLAESAAFRQLPPADRMSLEHHLGKVAGYAAECIRDDWASSQRLGQVPSRGGAPGSDRRPHPRIGCRGRLRAGRGEPDRAGSPRHTLRRCRFPDFVADLIRGSFNAIVNSSIQQMEAYTRAAGERGQDRRPVHGRQHHRQPGPRLAGRDATRPRSDWPTASPGSRRPKAPRMRRRPTGGRLVLPDDVSLATATRTRRCWCRRPGGKLAQSRLQTLSRRWC